ncbi:glycosyltransferase [Algibacter mikhailovii]|uniref:Glycosyl transferase group 1 n=1 Tax=Algibacter mikhailovii TaxID=425498 RepID=A0A918R2Z2_9FLAO|nr:glycosyltransferase [Algibacter mikhailovii]GGZ81001.1 glycosyl transferase group 1 [Algibacter mikhailovii]
MARRSKKIKILFTIPNFDTAGSGKALLKVALGLNKDLFEPHICCMHKKGAFFKEVEKSGIPVHVFEYTTLMKPYVKGIMRCFQISRVFKKINPDIIHSFHYAADYSEALAAKLAGIKWVYTKKNMNWGGRSKNGWLLRSKLATRILAQNTDMISEFFSKFNSVDLVPRGVDINEFFPAEVNSNKDFEPYGILENDRLIICVANLVPVKGVEFLIKAYMRLQQKTDGWKLLIVGDYNNDYGKSLLELASKQIESKHIVFTGKVLNVKGFLHRSEIFVLPTLDKGRKEGSPVAILEGMSCGLNVIASDIPGIRDQLKGFPNHIFKAGELDALTERLSIAVKNSVIENRLKGEAFVKHVHNHYTLKHEIQHTEAVYLKC